MLRTGTALLHRPSPTAAAADDGRPEIMSSKHDTRSTQLLHYKYVYYNMIYIVCVEVKPQTIWRYILYKLILYIFSFSLRQNRTLLSCQFANDKWWLRRRLEKKRVRRRWCFVPHIVTEFIIRACTIKWCSSTGPVDCLSAPYSYICPRRQDDRLLLLLLFLLSLFAAEHIRNIIIMYYCYC